MKAWRIVQWLKHYELNDQGRPVKTPERARVGPLAWFAQPVKGRSHSPSYRELIRASHGKHRLAVVWGVWCKLLELVAAQPRERRTAGLGGWLLDGDGRPATVADMAKWTAFLPRDIEHALNTLAKPELRWVECRELPDNLQPPTGTCRPLQEPAQHDTTEHDTTEERSSSSSPSLPPQPTASPQPLTPKAFALAVHEALQLGKGNAQQYAADTRAFKRAAERILNGALGPHTQVAVECCVTRAWEIGRDKAIPNKAGYWLVWFRERCKAHRAKLGGAA